MFREQIRIIVDSKDLKGAMLSQKRMANLQKSGYSLVDFKIENDTNDYYLEKQETA